LSKPIAKEGIEEISRIFGVNVEPENGTHFFVRGEKTTVKKLLNYAVKFNPGKLVKPLKDDGIEQICWSSSRFDECWIQKLHARRIAQYWPNHGQVG